VTEKLIESLPKGTEDEFRDLLLSISDTKLLLGYHFGEWTFRTPSMESGIAACNFAQDELGHVRLFHGMMKKHSAESDATLIHDRAADKYNSVVCLNSDISNWLELITYSAVVDAGTTILLESLKDSNFRPLRERVEKILQEEKFHSDYCNAWVASLASDGNGNSETVGDIFSKAVAAFTRWVQDINTTSLKHAGMMTSSAEEINESCFNSFKTMAKNAGLNIPGSMSDQQDNIEGFPQFPEEEIIYSLRGEKNEVFRV